MLQQFKESLASLVDQEISLKDQIKTHFDSYTWLHEVIFHLEPKISSESYTEVTTPGFSRYRERTFIKWSLMAKIDAFKHIILTPPKLLVNAEKKSVWLSCHNGECSINSESPQALSNYAIKNKIRYTVDEQIDALYIGGIEQETTMNLNNNPTPEQLAELFNECDDLAGDHVLWVDSNSDVHISLVPEDTHFESLKDQDMKLSYHPFKKGEQYVGEKAAQNSEWVKEFFDNLVQDWEKVGVGRSHVIRGTKQEQTNEST